MIALPLPLPYSEQDMPMVEQKQHSNEWYTLACYIEAAREVMGSIDLDPASCNTANETVRASNFFTKEDDGLSKEWYGSVWLNPPYYGYQENHRTNPMGIWSKKLITAYEGGQIEQAIMFVMGGTYCKWFAPLWSYLLCFTNHKVRFHRPKQMDEHLRDNTCFVYLGPHEQRFIEVFSQFGRIAKAIDTPKPKDSPRSLWEDTL